MVIVLGFDDGKRNISFVIQDIIGAFLLTTGVQLATHNNATLGEKDFSTNLERFIPSGLNDGGRNVLGTNIGLA